MFGAVDTRPTPRTLGDVTYYRLCGADELIGAVGMSARELRNDVDGQCKELNRALIDLETLETQHTDVIATLAG